MPALYKESEELVENFRLTQPHRFAHTPELLLRHDGSLGLLLDCVVSSNLEPLEDLRVARVIVFAKDQNFPQVRPSPEKLQLQTAKIWSEDRK